MVTKDRGQFAYAPPEDKLGNVIKLPDDELHHLLRVRRVRVGDTVFVTDGQGVVYRTILEPNHELKIIEMLSRFGEPKFDMYLVMGVLKGDANRDVVDIAVQLGVSEIHFFQADQSEGELRVERIQRLERMAIEAMKQCGRAILPAVVIHDSLANALDLLPSDCLKFLAHPSEADVIVKSNKIIEQFACATLIIGPEGGLSEEEIAFCLGKGSRQLTLGASRLRSMTAVAAGLSYILSIHGEYRSE